jgi:predicted ester cyclase/plastocyanin
VVARQALEAVNDAMASGDMSTLDAVFAAEVQGHPSHRSLVTGEPFSHDLVGLKAALADIRRFFPDAAITIDDLIASGETVAARVRFRGTPDAAVLGLEDAASQQMEIGGLIYGEIVGGLILEFWAYFDLSAYFDLIGVLPAGMTATPKAEAEHGHETDTELESPHPDAEQVAVTLTEFSVTPAPAILQVGQPYTFVVTNEGAVPHEFVIERAGAVHDPLVDDERQAMTEPIAPGTSLSLSWTFAEPGAYQLACHEPGHYEAGQVFVIDVTE